MIEPCWSLRILELGPGRWALVGELDLAGAAQLEDHLAGREGDVVLDCSGLTFVDAAGLGVFIRAHAACRRRGSRFVLVKPSRWLLRLLAITGLDEEFVTGVYGSGR